MNLYQKLKQANLIIKEEYLLPPCRMRAKTIGYMWESRLKTYIKGGKQINFKFWRHFFDDGGLSDWKPSQDKLDAAWRVSSIQLDDEFYDACWHAIYINDNIYISKKGFFGYIFGTDIKYDGDKYRDQVEKKIVDGSWKLDNDIVQII